MAVHSFGRVLGIATLPGLIAASAPPAAGSTEATLAKCFDMQAQKIPFSGVVVASDGKMRFERSAGFVDEAESRRPSTSVPFRLASLQKILTEVAIGQLIDRGKVVFDAPVGQYLQGLPTDLAKVTIDQLLHHRSGVASLTMLTPQIAQGVMSAKSSHDLVALVAAQPLAFEPGTRTEYSNGGYYLLGAVIEAVSGKSYGDYLKTQIFAPLRMTGSGMVPGPDTATRLTRLAPGEPPLEKPRALNGMLQIPATSAGDGISSAADLQLLGRALVGDTLLTKAVKARIFERRAEPWRIGQSGGSPGTNADFSAFPETGWVVVVLTNNDPPAGELMGEVLRKVANGAPCEPIGANDRPSPFRMLIKPPTGSL